MGDFVSDLEGDAAFIVAEQKTEATVVYTPLGTTDTPGSAVAVTAVWDPLKQDAGTHRDVRMEARAGILQTLPALTPEPDTRDTFTIDDVVYGVALVHVSEWIVEWALVFYVPHRHGGAESRVER